MEVHFYSNIQKHQILPNTFNQFIETLEHIYPTGFLKYCNIFCTLSPEEKIEITSEGNFDEMLEKFKNNQNNEKCLLVVELTAKGGQKSIDILLEAIQQGELPESLLEDNEQPYIP